MKIAEAYNQIARDHGLDPTQMALAWCDTRPFMARGSVIFGATTLAQLDNIIDGKDLVLSEEVMEAIDACHRANPMPY